MRGLAAVLGVLALAAPAVAQPGDPLPEPLTPADGATLPTDPDGVDVTFTCPLYRSSPADEAPASDYRGYIARFARSQDCDRGSSDNARQSGSSCAGTFKDSEGSQAVPGRVYWRVDRSCFCPGGAERESGPVRSFVLRAPKPELTTKVQSRAYAGYAIEVELRTSDDVAAGTEVALERRAGSTWKTVDDARVSKRRAEGDVTLPRGTHQLRWTLTRGDQVDRSPPAKVKVVRAARWSTSARDDGRYSGKPGTLKFRVTRDGRELRDFEASLTAFCVGPTLSQNRFIVAFAAVPRARIAPDGRFLAKVKVSQTDLTLRGRLRNRRVTGGRIDIGFSTCSGSRTFIARRR